MQKVLCLFAIIKTCRKTLEIRDNAHTNIPNCIACNRKYTRIYHRKLDCITIKQQEVTNLIALNAQNLEGYRENSLDMVNLVIKIDIAG